ncbi:S1 family peptidase [Amycolatopsis magusensis]|uniref:S1 family peptidase n=1 Tax=Amycolatopsis magusensis TaxID=882444 RepID=UPI003C3038C7
MRGITGTTQRNGAGHAGEPWRISIQDLSGSTLGAGIFLGEYTALTCAHVLSDDPEADPSGLRVRVRFVGLDGQPGVDATVVREGWVPQTAAGGDVALLRLAEQPAVPGAPLCHTRAVRDRTVHTYGFPEPHDNGVWVNNAELAGPAGEWVQLNSPLPGERVRRGFSGAGVIDKATGAVIGMVVTEYTDETTGLAFMIPTRVLTGYVPALAEFVAGEVPDAPGTITVLISDRHTAITSGFSEVVGDRAGRMLTLDTTGKSPREVSHRLEAERGRAQWPPTVALAAVDSSSQPERLLHEVVRPLLERGAQVIVQFSADNAPGAGIARDWQRDENAARLDRLRQLAAGFESEEDGVLVQARRLAKKIQPLPEFRPRSAELVLLLGAADADEPTRMHRRLTRIEDWVREQRDQLTVYQHKLAAKAEEYDELRGQLSAYNAMAVRHGLMEDEELAEVYLPAKAALSARPCSLPDAVPLVHSYATAVRRKLARA